MLDTKTDQRHLPHTTEIYRLHTKANVPKCLDQKLIYGAVHSIPNIHNPDNTKKKLRRSLYLFLSFV